MEEDIGVHRTSTLDNNQRTNYTHDDYTLQNVTNFGLHPIQYISTETNFTTSLSACTLKKTNEIQLRCPTLQSNKRHKTLYAPLKFENRDIHTLLGTGAVRM